MSTSMITHIENIVNDALDAGNEMYRDGATRRELVDFASRQYWTLDAESDQAWFAGDYKAARLWQIAANWWLENVILEGIERRVRN